MIKTTAMLKKGLQEYVNPIAKIRHLVDSGELVPIVNKVCMQLMQSCINHYEITLYDMSSFFVSCHW